MKAQTIRTIIVQLREAQDRALKTDHDMELAATLYSIRKTVATL